MVIYGDYALPVNKDGCVDYCNGHIEMSVEELYCYLSNEFQDNIVLIAWLPNIRQIYISYEVLKITFYNGEKISLYDEDTAKYLKKCIANEYK